MYTHAQKQTCTRTCMHMHTNTHMHAVTQANTPIQRYAHTAQWWCATLLLDKCMIASSCILNHSFAFMFSELRKPYKGEQEIFDVDSLSCLEPFGQFQEWFDIASKTESIHEANAMSLATSSK